MPGLNLFERIALPTSQLTEGLADRAPYLFVGAVLFFASWVAAKIVTRAVRGILSRVSTAGHVDVLLARLAGIGTFIVGALIALSAMQIRVTALVTSLGLVGVAVGFALKELLSSWIAGVLLLLQRPFTIGDTVSIGVTEGVVRDVRLRDTVLECADGRMAYVPNLIVFTSVITNASVNAIRRVEIEIALSPTSDIAAATDRIAGAVSGLPFVAKSPTVEAAVLGATHEAVRVVVRAWVDTASVGFSEARRRVALEAARVAQGTLIA